MSLHQKTLKSEISFKGKGLHTGLEVTMKVVPVGEGKGIVFRRVDLSPTVDIPALSLYVTDTSRGTTIEKDGAKVSTIEHIMAALWTNGVDNALIEIDAPEVPIMDGSAREYSAEIERVGVKDQGILREYMKLTRKTEFQIADKGVKIEVFPEEEYSVTVHIDFNSRVLGNQYAVYKDGDDFNKEIAPCRTFVFLHEIEPLLNLNLIKGGDLDNAIVVVENEVDDKEIERLKGIFNKKDIQVDKRGYLNNLELRYVNEPARHKLLDVLGDLALLGMRIKGRVVATRPGHLANTELVKELRKEYRRAGVIPQYDYDPTATPVYTTEQIMDRLPHRPPFLLVDKIIHIDQDSVAGIKNVTMNEPFFIGHFPGNPVMPGVLIVEAMAQCGGLLAIKNMGDIGSFSTYFVKIDGVKFKSLVVPGDTLQFELKLMEPIRRGIVKMASKAFVGGVLVAEAELMAQVVKND